MSVVLVTCINYSFVFNIFRTYHQKSNVFDWECKHTITIIIIEVQHYFFKVFIPVTFTLSWKILCIFPTMHCFQWGIFITPHDHLYKISHWKQYHCGKYTVSSRDSGPFHWNLFTISQIREMMVGWVYKPELPPTVKQWIVRGDIFSKCGPIPLNS